MAIQIYHEIKLTNFKQYKIFKIFQTDASGCCIGYVYKYGVCTGDCLEHH